MASNLGSLYGSTKVNGFFVASDPNTFLADCNPAYISYVMPITFTDQAGTSVNGFLIEYQEPQNLLATKIFMAPHTNLTTIANFASGLAAVQAASVGGNSFTTYTNLVKSSDKATFPASTSILINDQLTALRQYMVNAHQTKITVNVKNRLLATAFFCTGDQTYAGSYKYLTSSGNV